MSWILDGWPLMVLKTTADVRAAQKIKFTKMPVRNRSGSSPIRSSKPVEVHVISPSRRSNEGRLRSGSLTSVEAIKQRARRDTTTSSDFSSDNDLDPLAFKRRALNPRKAAQAGDLLSQKHQEDEQAVRAADSDQSSEFDAASADSESILDDFASSSLSPAPLRFRRSPSPKKIALSPPRPISVLAPVSLLGQALRDRRKEPSDPLDSFARLSGKGVPDPLYIKIFVPHSTTPARFLDIALLKVVEEDDDHPKVTVAEAIGFSLWAYKDDSRQPPLSALQSNVNRWTLRMIEDGEVDLDFPALTRTKPIMDFTSNNNRGARGRSRTRPYDEFALVAADASQYENNKTLTPKYEYQTDTSIPVASRPVPADKPQLVPNHSTPRYGTAKELLIHHVSVEATSHTLTINLTTDTYLAEVLDQACKKWGLEKAHHLLKVRGTNTVAPVDRTVEALGTMSELELVRRRFMTDGSPSSPQSSSPNAPLSFDINSPKKSSKRSPAHFVNHDRTRELLAHGLAAGASSQKYKRYNVVRRQPMSLAPSQARILLLDEDCLNIVPPETHSGKTLLEAVSDKTSRRIAYGMIIGCKVSRRHPKSLRVIVARQDTHREGEQKRYDFEAFSTVDAAEIVEEINSHMIG